MADLTRLHPSASRSRCREEERRTKAKLMTPMASKTRGRMNVQRASAGPLRSSAIREPSIKTEHTMTSMPARATSSNPSVSPVLPWSGEEGRG